jgi:fructosamine-3-kinase
MGPVDNTTKGVPMNDEDMVELGPIDYLVVEFPADKADFSGAMAEQLQALVEAGTVRVLDLLIITKDEAGEVDAFELHEFEDGGAEALSELGAESARLLSEEDVGHIGAALEPGTVAAALVFENSWAAPFAVSVRESGGQLVASGRIPTQAILAAAEASAAAQTEGD